MENNNSKAARRGSRGRRLAVDLAFWLAGIVTFTMVLLGAVYFFVTVNQANKTLTEQATFRVEELATVLSSPTWNLDKAAIKQIAVSYQVVQNVAAIRVLDDKGGALYESVTDEKGLIVETRPILFGGRQVGSVELSVSTQEITKLSRDILFQVLAVLAVVIVTILVATWFLLQRFLGNPLAVLTQGIEKFAGGSYEVRLKPLAQQELNIIVEQFNAMAEQIQARGEFLEQQVADRTRALATSSEVSRRISTILDQNELVTEVVNQVREAFGYYHAQIYFLDEASNNLIMAAGTGEAGEMMLAQFHKVAKGRGLVGRAAESNQPVLVADTLHNSEWLPNQLLPDTRSEVAIPISIGEQVLGVLDVQHNIVEGLRPEEIDALQAIANQVAIALQNARQVQQTVALASELASFQSAVSEAAIVATTDVSGKIEAVNEKFVQISKYSREELLGQDHRILNSGYHTKEFMRNLWVTIANGKVWRNEIRNKAKDGSFYWVDTTIAPVLNDRGKPIKYVAIRFDITQRKELEFNVAQRAASLGQLDNITQKIQSTTSIESALQIAVRELGHAFGMKPTFVTLDPGVLAGEPKQAATPNLPNETESLGTGVSQ